jgi:hypothetical protein
MIESAKCVMDALQNMFSGSIIGGIQVTYNGPEQRYRRVKTVSNFLELTERNLVIGYLNTTLPSILNVFTQITEV